MKVMFRVPTSGAPRLSSVKIVRALDKAYRSWDTDFYKFKISYIQTAWSFIVKEAQDKEVDFLIVMCDDFGLEDPKVLSRLPKHDVPVVDCATPGWQNGFFYWHIYHLDKNGIFYSDHPYDKTELTQVYSTATGCICIRKDVLDRIGKDIFYVPDCEKNGTPKWLGGCDSHFCRQLHKKNIPLYVDTEIQFDHSSVVNMKETMERERDWTRHCVDQRQRDSIIRWGSMMSSRICVDTKKLGVKLPVCKSYKETDAWKNDLSWVSPSYPPKEMVVADLVNIPNNG